MCNRVQFGVDCGSWYNEHFLRDHPHRMNLLKYNASGSPTKTNTIKEQRISNAAECNDNDEYAIEDVAADESGGDTNSMHSTIMQDMYGVEPNDDDLAVFLSTITTMD